MRKPENERFSHSAMIGDSCPQKISKMVGGQNLCSKWKLGALLLFFLAGLHCVELIQTKLGQAITRSTDGYPGEADMHFFAGRGVTLRTAAS